MEISQRINYLEGIPENLGCLLNDELDNCTCAAYYHALQVWNYNILGDASPEPSQYVRALYRQSCGYAPDSPGRGPGGDERVVLTYLMNDGAPTRRGMHKLFRFIHLNLTNKDLVRLAIKSCGVIYLCLAVPRYIKPEGMESPYLWDRQTLADNSFVGNHAVISAGYDVDGLYIISCGKQHFITWEFFNSFIYGVYALVDSAWLDEEGKTPLGDTLEELIYRLLRAAN